MGKFFGTYQRTLDEKKRLQIPSKLVKEMPLRFYVLKGFEGCLSVYEEAEFEALLAKLDSLNYFDPTARAYVRVSAASAAELEVDSHGRISISTEMAARYHLESEVTIIGALNHFEIWDSAAYQKYSEEANARYEQLASESAK